MDNKMVIKELVCQSIQLVNSAGDDVGWVEAMEQGAHFGIGSQNGTMLEGRVESSGSRLRVASPTGPSEIIACLTGAQLVIALHGGPGKLPHLKVKANLISGAITAQLYKDGQIVRTVDNQG
jgi:hypothetical protein